MIPRTLVPVKLAPVAPETDAARPRRVSTVLDERTLVPPRLPFVALETRSAIPDYVPLDVLSNRVLVPRDALKGALDLPPAAQAWPVSEMDERIAVPPDAHPVELVAAEPVPFEKIDDLLEPDVLTTGDVNLMPREVSAGAKQKSPLVPLLSVAVHGGLALLVFLIAVLFPPHKPTQAELDLARNQLGIVYLPNSVFSEPKAAPAPRPAGPPVRVSPKILREAAPPPVLPAPEPPREPPKVARELPSAPLPAEPAPRAEPPRQAARLEPPKELPDTSGKLVLPRMSPGREIEESARSTGPGSDSGLPSFGAPIRRGGGIGGGGGGGGRGGGMAMGGLEMLTPTEGVDFDSYLRRVYYKVKQNWENVMPESVWLGEKGIVVLEFRIMRDGTVPPSEPNLMGSNAREPLERAAISSIRGSNPFEPLPPTFSGPFILLRYTYLYNIPPEAIH